MRLSLPSLLITLRNRPRIKKTDSWLLSIGWIGADQGVLAVKVDYDGEIHSRGVIFSVVSDEVSCRTSQTIQISTISPTPQSPIRQITSTPLVFPTNLAGIGLVNVEIANTYWYEMLT